MNNTAIVLAGGQGKRMGGNLPKQFMKIAGKPVLYYSLMEFQKSTYIQNIVLVVGEEWQEYCRDNILEPFGMTKVSCMTAGGAERYDSVYNGLCACGNTEYVFIHDGARPFVSQKMIQDGYESAVKYGSAIAGVPSKDTIKIVGSDNQIIETPPRNLVWNIQTPQIFEYATILNAHEKLKKSDKSGITDDAMVMEKMTGRTVYTYEAEYTNIKITTPEDMIMAELILKQQGEDQEKVIFE